MSQRMLSKRDMCGNSVGLAHRDSKILKIFHNYFHWFFVRYFHSEVDLNRSKSYWYSKQGFPRTQLDLTTNCEKMRTAVLFRSLILAKVFAGLLHEHEGKVTQSLSKFPLLSPRNSTQDSGAPIVAAALTPVGGAIALYEASFDFNNHCETVLGMWQIMETPDSFLLSCNESFGLPGFQQTICENNYSSSTSYLSSQCNDIYMELYQAYLSLFPVQEPNQISQVDELESACSGLFSPTPTNTNSTFASWNVTCNFGNFSLSDFFSPTASVCEGGGPLEGYPMWQMFDVDSNLQIFLAGGIDNQGIPWTGLQDKTLSAAIGAQMLNEEGYSCSLEDACTTQIGCERIGSYSFLPFGQPVLNLGWVYLVVEAFQNINQQLSNQYKAIDVSAIDSTLATFNIDDFYPQPKPPSGLLDALIGLGTIFSIAGGFVPVFGPGLSAVGAILPAMSSFLGNSITASTDPNIVQESFAPLVEQVISDLVGALDSAASKLFDGDSINGVTIIDMMKGGYWINNTSLEPLFDITNQMTIEILSRSIDSLWKIPTHNKMWVLFADLGDGDNSTAKCNNDNSGPPDSKYCADGGVYYTYNFIETGHLAGYLGYPWGATKLSEFNITISV